MRERIDILEQDLNVQEYAYLLQMYGEAKLCKPIVQSGGALNDFLFKNLETGREISISAHVGSTIYFEMTNTAIYPKCEDKIYFCSNDIRKQYFSDLLTISPNEAVQRVLKYKH